MTPRPNLLCPVCGGPNGCQPAVSGSFDTPCWCAALELPPPSEPAQNASCLCMRCAMQAAQQLQE
jgi:hypothetical protein